VGWLLLAALALLALAAWCTSAETALLRVSRAGAKELGRSPGEGGAAPLQAVLAEISRYLSVLVLVRVAGEIAATVLVTAVFLHWIPGGDWKAFLTAAAVMVVACYAIAAVIPRGVSRHRAGRVATSAAAILRPVVVLLGPLPRLLASGSVLSPGGEGGDSPSGSEEELRGLVDLLEQRQIIQPDERAMIHSVFELGDTIAREVMVPRTDMVFVERGKTLRQAMSLALRSGFSRIPVVGENLDDVVGIAYLKDLVTRGHEHPEGETVETVGSVMRPATFVPESKPIDELLREMQARQIHMAIVIDEYGGTAGLVTIEDILEEIVGEITDEYDREQPPIEWLGDDEARVTARLPVEELAEIFDVGIEAQDVETVGGLLAQCLGRVPLPGAVATVAGLRLTAESLAGRRNRIGTVRVERVHPGVHPAPANRPAPGDRPGPADRGVPADRPVPGDRPAPSERPGPADRPAPGDGPDVGDRLAPGNRPAPGGRRVPDGSPGDRPAGDASDGRADGDRSATGRPGPPAS
jgi:CBS domain containing-hemolysin-like protein